MAITVDGKQVDTNTLEITNIVAADYPDFCDAYFCNAKFEDGTVLTEAQIDTLNAEYTHEVNRMIHSQVRFIF